jgi:hypothetical protein
MRVDFGGKIEYPKVEFWGCAVQKRKFESILFVLFFSAAFIGGDLCRCLDMAFAHPLPTAHTHGDTVTGHPCDGASPEQPVCPAHQLHQVDGQLQSAVNVPTYTGVHALVLVTDSQSPVCWSIVPQSHAPIDQANPGRFGRPISILNKTLLF